MGVNVPEDLIALNEHIHIRFHRNTTYDSSYCQEKLSLWANKVHSCTLTLQNFCGLTLIMIVMLMPPQNALLFSHLFRSIENLL